MRRPHANTHGQNNETHDNTKNSDWCEPKGAANSTNNTVHPCAHRHIFTIHTHTHTAQELHLPQRSSRPMRVHFRPAASFDSAAVWRDPPEKAAWFALAPVPSVAAPAPAEPKVRGREERVRQRNKEKRRRE